MCVGFVKNCFLLWSFLSFLLNVKLSAKKYQGRKYKNFVECRNPGKLFSIWYQESLLKQSTLLVLAYVLDSVGLKENEGENYITVRK